MVLLCILTWDQALYSSSFLSISFPSQYQHKRDIQLGSYASLLIGCFPTEFVDPTNIVITLTQKGFLKRKTGFLICLPMLNL